MKLKAPRSFHLEFGHRFVIATLVLISPFFLFFSPEIGMEVIPINFPENSPSMRVCAPPIILVATADKAYYVNNSKVEFNSLEEELMLKTRRNEYRKDILLRLDSSLTVQELVDILSIGAKNHLNMIMVLPEVEEELVSF